MSVTVRLTVAQATVEFLAHQYSERDGVRRKLFAGCLGIFGHGNVAGIGQALLQHETAALAAGETPGLPYVLARNEQAMVHTAVGYARQKDRLQTWVCTASVGPGSTNMLTGAALATINRIPVLLLPSGTFATRRSAPVLQELEHFGAGDVTVNDAFRPLSTYFDRVSRAEQLPSALLNAMRVLTDPAQTGAVTLSLPQDVQAEAYDWPEELFADRVWHVARPPAEKSRIQAAADLIRDSRRPLIVAGGGVHYSGAEDALAAFCEATGIPVGESQAGKGSLLHGHPQLLGAVGSTGTTAANAIARDADLVIGIGTRWSDFTTASRTAFQAAGVRFVNVNVANFDAGKQSGLAVVADAREALESLTEALQGWSVDDGYRTEQARLWANWDAAVEATYHPGPEVTAALAPGRLTQGTVLGLVNELTDPRDVVLCAAGSMPGDLHKLWRVRDRRGYHVEYGYSCMGYEVPASIGIRLADESRDVFAMVGDGGYLMMPTELVTAVQERVKVIVVLVQNHGFHSIGSLSESLGSQRFGTRYRFRGQESHQLDGGTLPVDLAANARSLGVHVIEVHSRDELGKAIQVAKHAPSDGGPILIHVETDPLIHGPDSDSWWDVPVSEVSELDSTAAAYDTYLQHKRLQRHHF
ncbi:3D-(3,5/4)-trihydroxycyclohexane-1,2-dione acylhydrolase (decyclizing) [Actinoplanes derwentensis]|uniref:3D-(3,5/4)-trihydroxycyclohexane-1,2-dione hydrolase n=1 Tax=Actinoplanes derwentensis TaxID=113562 RepID=A0A1H1V8M0_9ACTN|nr:3D-(3,5/4)-trihydroxycyclohexane-1,2-dione acylhydrolase (decyclizing) [Actinoplanes derwentensis]GID89261.1 3D-(3,5/4)-trihydroxycyclohexane-1,2-dione acylhydrolase (decyclizing) [Actinoplanes derwentensis]SDS80990.1 3D-(3,5/4)-trihydroxycyclohexane-1,2-dione hydrolase [Actinoplanes derwentensis]